MMTKIITFLIILISANFSFAADSSGEGEDIAQYVTVDSGDDIYKNMSIDYPAGVTSWDKTYGYFSPFVEIPVRYTMFGMAFNHRKTFNMLGDCDFAPFPLRICARLFEKDGGRYLGLFADSVDLNDHKVFYQPFNLNQTFNDDGLKKLYLSLGMYPNTKVASFFDRGTTLKYLSKVLTYWEKNGKTKPYNLTNFQYKYFDFLIPNKPLYNLKDNYTENDTLPTIFIEKICENNQSFKVSDPCLFTYARKSSFAKMSVRITPFNAYNSIPACEMIGDYGLPCVTYKAGSSPSVMPLMLNMCRDENDSECLVYNGKGSAPTGSQSIIYTPYIHPTKYNSPGMNQVEMRRFGVVSESSSIILDINFADSFPRNVPVNYVTSMGKVQSVVIQVRYNPNDKYVCFHTQKDSITYPLGCVERPNMDLPIVEACTTGKGCPSNFSYENPSILVTVPGASRKEVIAVGDKKKILGWEFANIALDTANKKLGMKNGKYDASTATKVCLWGYQTYNPRTIIKKEYLVFKHRDTGSMLFDVPGFWQDAFVKNIEGEADTVTDFNNAGYRSVQHIVSYPLPLHDSSLKLCLDIPPQENN